jgi:hypothetical protein
VSWPREGGQARGGRRSREEEREKKGKKEKRKGKRKKGKRKRKKGEGRKKRKMGRKIKKRGGKIGEGILEKSGNLPGKFGKGFAGFFPVLRASAHFPGRR